MKQFNISERIRSVMEKRGLNKHDAAKEIGLHYTSITRLLDGTHKWIKPENEAKIMNWLARYGQRLSLHEPGAVYLTSRFREVRVYGLAQACTMNNPPCDISPEINEADLPTIVVPVSNGHRMAAFRVEGDSMTPALTAGMVAICDCDDKNFENGKIVVAKFNDIAVVKRYRRVGDTILLTSDNRAAGTDYELHASDISWMIKVVGFQGVL